MVIKNNATQKLAMFLFVWSLFFLGQAKANENLAQSKNCMSCHSISSPRVGPPFKSIAQRYLNRKGIEAVLERKILKGGSGEWGEESMPPNAQLSDNDAKTLVKWVLSLKQSPVKPKSVK